MDSYSECSSPPGSIYMLAFSLVQHCVKANSLPHHSSLVKIYTNSITLQFNLITLINEEILDYDTICNSDVL